MTHSPIMTSMIAAVTFVCALIFSNGDCLKLVKVEVPRYKVRGELAILQCHYELEGDTLYAVKWYKENEEFYRYIPKSVPPTASYQVQGVRVDHSLSDSKQVALRTVNLKTSGMYRCEVSAEAPSFASAAAESPMTVLFIPQSGPHISGERKQYLIGDDVSLNCTSGKSYPASVLHWFINDREVKEEENLIRYQTQAHPHGLLTTILGLRMRVEPHHYLGDSMRLKCVASLSPAIWRGSKESAVGLPVARNREALLLVKGGGSLASLSSSLILLTLYLSLS